MSLKSFHIFFILTSFALMGFLLWWGASRWNQGEPSAGMLVAGALAGFGAGVPYLSWFVKKVL